MNDFIFWLLLLYAENLLLIYSLSLDLFLIFFILFIQYISDSKIISIISFNIDFLFDLCEAILVLIILHLNRVHFSHWYPPHHNFRIRLNHFAAANFFTSSVQIDDLDSIYFVHTSLLITISRNLQFLFVC